MTVKFARVPRAGTSLQVMTIVRQLGRYVAGLMLLWLLAGCQKNEITYRTQGKVFGTAVEISIFGESVARSSVLATAVLNEFGRLHQKFHAWQPSALTALNDSIARGEPYQADAEMVVLLQAATSLAEKSENTFNPAIGHLIRLWGFQSSDITLHGPPRAEVKRWVDANPRMTNLVFDGTRISSRNSAVMLDMGGIAKGYALDRAAQILRAEQVDAALINIGGSILAIRQPGNRPWRVGVQDPRGDGMVASVALHDNEAIGTSGDYQRFFMEDGRRRPHIIDPKIGELIDLVQSVAIITSGGADAGTRSDGHTKPLFIVGPQRWQAMAQRLGLKDVMLIDVNKNTEITPAMQARMHVPEGVDLGQ